VAETSGRRYICGLRECILKRGHPTISIPLVFVIPTFNFLTCSTIVYLASNLYIVAIMPELKPELKLQLVSTLSPMIELQQ